MEAPRSSLRVLTLNERHRIYLYRAERTRNDVYCLSLLWRLIIAHASLLLTASTSTLSKRTKCTYRNAPRNSHRWDRIIAVTNREKGFLIILWSTFFFCRMISMNLENDNVTLLFIINPAIYLRYYFPLIRSLISPSRFYLHSIMTLVTSGLSTRDFTYCETLWITFYACTSIMQFLDNEFVLTEGRYRR